MEIKKDRKNNPESPVLSISSYIISQCFSDSWFTSWWNKMGWFIWNSTRYSYCYKFLKLFNGLDISLWVYLYVYYHSHSYWHSILNLVFELVIFQMNFHYIILLSWGTTQQLVFIRQLGDQKFFVRLSNYHLPTTSN